MLLKQTLVEMVFAHGAKPKRISYSTSHSETLAAMSGLETASLVSLRLAELLCTNPKPTLQQLAALQERGVPFLPVDAMTDCKDFYALSTGTTSLPQDKSQRIYILAHREARLCGRLRWIILVPTQSMVADALTKVMLSKQLLHLMSTGKVDFYNQPGHPIEARRLPAIDEFSEEDLHEGDEKWISGLLSRSEVEKIQHFTTTWTRPSAFSARSTSWRTSSSIWLLALLCVANFSGGMAMTEDDGQCPSNHFEFNWWRNATILVSAAFATLMVVIYKMWKMIVRLDAALHHGEDLQADLRDRLQPLEQANLVTRVLQAENNVTELQCQLGENAQDINTLYRAVRRHASPHPDEPSSSRARHVDRRPAQPEPEEERAFNDAASRSRDGPEEPDGELEDEEGGASDFDYSDDSAIDDIHHSRNYMLRRQEVLRDQIHNMTVQANNMECYLHTELQLSGGPLPLAAILHLAFLPLVNTLE
eukprot:s140_g14.t1